MKKIILFTALLIMNTAAFANSAYNEFKFEVVGKCSEINTVGFFAITSHDMNVLGEDSKGHLVMFDLLVQLFDDGTYYAEYVESTWKTMEYGVHSFEHSISGKWSVNAKNEIEMAGLGVGRIVNYEGKLMGREYKTAISFQLNVAFNDLRAKGQQFILGHSYISTGPKGVSINQYCGVE